MGFHPLQRLDPTLLESLRLLAHLFTEDELQERQRDAPDGLPQVSPRTLNHRIEQLYDALVAKEPERFLGFVERLGLDTDCFAARVGSPDGLSVRKRGALLACLYWAHAADQSSVRGQTAATLNLDMPRRLGFPVVVLDADLRPHGGWTHRGPGGGADVECRLVDAPDMEVGPDLVEAVWSGVREAAPNVTDSPTLFGLRGYHCVREQWDQRARTGVRIDLAPTNFRIFKATNDVYQVHGGAFAAAAWRLGLGARELDDPYALGQSRLANALSVCVFATARDEFGVEWLGIQRRNVDQTAGAAYVYGATTSAFVSVAANRSDTPMPGQAPNPFRTVCREFAEEVGTFDGEHSPIMPEDVVFTGLVRELASCWEPGLVGEVTLPFPFERLRDLLPGVDHYFEGRGVGGRAAVEWVEADPEAVSAWMIERQAGFPHWTPLGLTALMFVLLRRHPLRSVELAFAEVRARYGEHLLMPDDHARPARPDRLRRLAVPMPVAPARSVFTA